MSLFQMGCGSQALRDSQGASPPSLHTLVWSPLTLNQGRPVRLIESCSSDRVVRPKPGYKRHCNFWLGLPGSLLWGKPVAMSQGLKQSRGRCMWRGTHWPARTQQPCDWATMGADSPAPIRVYCSPERDHNQSHPPNGSQIPDP